MQGLILKNLMHTEITGTGVAFPDQGKWIRNEDIHALLYGEDWADKMLEKNINPCYPQEELGFKKRFWVHTPGTDITHNELTSADLMIAASKEAIKNSGIVKDNIDFVIAVTITSPRYTTSMGAFISKSLGIKSPAIEMKCGCAANIFSLTFAAQLIQNGARNVLIACGETNTKILKMNPKTVYAGGDEGSAVVVSRASRKKGIVTAYLNTDGDYCNYMGVPGLMPPNQKDLDEKNYDLMYSPRAEKFLDQVWSITPEVLYTESKLNADDIDCLIPHQVNKKRISFISEAAKVPMSKTINVIEEFANCGSATLLLALDRAYKSGQLQEEKIALLAAAGGGISWGGIILRT
jgi:3-oxoacyl-[acyl-carrier-protein] synthase III